jgi:hypothetical protein
LAIAPKSGACWSVRPGTSTSAARRASASTRGEDPNDFRNFEFHPLPGETLTMRITRPAPVQSGLRAIDAAVLQSDVGQRASTHH